MPYTLKYIHVLGTNQHFGNSGEWDGLGAQQSLFFPGDINRTFFGTSGAKKRCAGTAECRVGKTTAEKAESQWGAFVFACVCTADIISY